MAEAVASPGPLTPAPVATVTRPAAAIPCVIHLAAVRLQKLEYPIVGPAPGHRPERVHQLRMGRDHAGAVPFAISHRDGRRGGGKVQVPPLQIERHSRRANSQGRPACMAAKK